MSPLLALAALVSAETLLGLGLLAALGVRLPRPSRMATGFALGHVLTGAAALGYGAAFGSLAILPGRVLLLAAAGLGLALLALGRRTEERSVLRAPTMSSGEPWTPLGIACATGVLVLALLCLIDAASAPVTDFDPRVHFAAKGALLFTEGFGTSGWTDFDGAVGRVLTHPSYPPGLGAQHALTASLLGHFDPDPGRALLALFVLVPGGWLAALLADRPRRARLTVLAAWFGLPLLHYLRLPAEETGRAFVALALGSERASASLDAGAPLLRPDGPVLGGGADLPLAALVTAALALLVLPAPRSAINPADGLETDGHASSRRSARRALVAGLLLGGAALTKNEGTPLALVLLGLVTVAAVLRPVARWRLHAWLPFALLTGGWWLLRSRLPELDEDYLARATPVAVFGGLGRAGEVAREFLASFASVLHWGLLWPLFALALLVRARDRAQRDSRVLLAGSFVLFGVLLYAAVLLVTPWDLAVLFRTGIPDRLLLHLAPAALLVVALAAWPATERGTETELPN